MYFEMMDTMETQKSVKHGVFHKKFDNSVEKRNTKATMIIKIEVRQLNFACLGKYAIFKTFSLFTIVIFLQ